MLEKVGSVYVKGAPTTPQFHFTIQVYKNGFWVFNDTMSEKMWYANTTKGIVRLLKFMEDKYFLLTDNI